MSQKLRQLLSELADGTGWKWYSEKRTKLPSDNNDDFFGPWRHGLSSKAMHEVVDRLRQQSGVEHQIVILLKTSQHDDGCKCLGCGQFQEVTQDFVVFWVDQGRVHHRLTQVKWISDMGGFDRVYGLLYYENEITLGAMLENNDSLIYTLGSHFDYQTLLDSL